VPEPRSGAPSGRAMKIEQATERSCTNRFESANSRRCQKLTKALIHPRSLIRCCVRSGRMGWTRRTTCLPWALDSNGATHHQTTVLLPGCRPRRFPRFWCRSAMPRMRWPGSTPAWRQRRLRSVRDCVRGWRLPKRPAGSAMPMPGRIPWILLCATLS
jgi:hypothetical protein